MRRKKIPYHEIRQKLRKLDISEIFPYMEEIHFSQRQAAAKLSKILSATNVIVRYSLTSDIFTQILENRATKLPAVAEKVGQRKRFSLHIRIRAYDCDTWSFFVAL